MSGTVKLLVAGCVALVLPLVLLKMGGGPAPTPSQGQRMKAAVVQADAVQAEYEAAMEAFNREADMRNRFINGFGRLQTARMLIGDYHFKNYELPVSFEQLGHDLSGAHPDGPDAFEMDPQDSSVTMYFDGQEDIKDGAVTYTPTVDENNEKIAWECWTTDYPDIENMVSVCKYHPPR